MSVVLPVSMQEAKDSGNPFFIELYIINLRTGTMYLAACDENIVFNGQTFVGVPFQRGEITKTMDNIVDSCEITLGDCSFEFVKFALNGFDFRGCSATILRIQYPDSLDDSSVVQWVFSGTIDEPSFSAGTFSCKLTARLPKVDCPNRDYRIACNSEFGDEECGMNLCETSESVQKVSGNIVELSNAYDDDYWQNGVITIAGEARNIVESSGRNVRVNVNFVQRNIVGKKVTLIRGCNKTAANCRKYNNMKHFSGFPAIPFESEYR